MKRLLIYFCIITFTLVVIPLLGIKFLDVWLGSQISAWIQTGVAVVSFPLIIFELDRIRQSINQKPDLEIGLVTTDHLPFSDVRNMQNLYQKVTVTTGYPHIYFVVRNRKNSPIAKSIKIYMEHKNRSQYLPQPLLKVSEFTEGKPAFVAENNFDFVFRAPTNWVINSGDIEPFGFHAKTAVVNRTINPAGIPYDDYLFPDRSEIRLQCMLWAEGLSEPICKSFIIEIIDNTPEDEEE